MGVPEDCPPPARRRRSEPRPAPVKKTQARPRGCPVAAPWLPYWAPYRVPYNRCMNPASNLILVGPMGAGKTCIGKRLAERFGLRLADADREIEQRTGTSVA